MNKRKLILTAVALAALLVASTIIYHLLKGQVGPGAQINTQSTGQSGQTSGGAAMLPNFTFYNTAGEEVEFESFIGKPVVLNFWASWCPPCKGEMPEFQEVYDDLSEDIVFIMMNVTDGQRETRETAMAYIEEAGYTFPVYFDEGLQVCDLLGVYAYPTTVFVNASGQAVAAVQGQISKETILQGIALIKP